MSVFDNITKKVAETAKVAATKANDIVEVTKLNINIASEEDKIKKIYSEIGKAVCDAYTNGEDVGGGLKEYCEKIRAIEESIEEMKKKILEMKNLKTCPGCSAELEADVAYCPKCGTKQQIIKPIEKSVEND